MKKLVKFDKNKEKKMNIAIASETEEIDGLVPATFKESPFLMIIDADKNQIFHVYGKQDPDNLVFAKKVVEHDCEAVICDGSIEKEPFEILVKAGVTRYLGSGHTVQKAYSYMNRYKLELIRDYIGEWDHLDTAMISAASVGKKRNTSTRKG